MGRLLLLSMIFFIWTIQGQENKTNCPTVENYTQNLCESEGTGNFFHKPRISDLMATDGGDGIVWYETATSTEPLSETYLLVNGEDYFAGNSSGTCANRPMVTVIINDSPNAGATTFVTFCSSDSPVDLLSVYRPSLLGPPQAGGIMTPALASGNTVFDPAVDIAGRYKYTVQSLNSVCPDDDSYIYVSIEQAPNAGESGIANFSSGISTSDLFNFLGGSPDIGGTWSPQLASGTGVFDRSIDQPGIYTYTVNGGLYCEDATATVTVYFQDDPVAKPCPIVENDTQNLCESEGTGNFFHKPRISDLMATDGGDGIVWYETATSTEQLGGTYLLVNGEDYFAGNSSGTCANRPMVTVIINDSPNAGATTFVTFCSSDSPVDLLSVYRPSLLGPPQAGGIMTPALASGNTVFDPAVDIAGRYKYTVQSLNSVCPDDDSYIYVSIEQAPNAGESGIANFSSGISTSDLFNFLGGSPDIGGTWSPQLASGTGVFDRSIDQPGIYTYTVNGGLYCEDATATVTVYFQDDPVAKPCPIVENDTQNLCESEGTGNFFHKPRISDLMATDGGDGIVWYETATSTEPLSETYLLVNGEDYFAGNSSGTCTNRPMVTVIINDSPNAGATTFVTFYSNGAPVDLLSVYRPSLLGPPQAGGIMTPALASGTTVFDPGVDIAGRYKYTVQSPNSVCPDDDSIIYVSIEQDPNAVESTIADIPIEDKDNSLKIAVYPNPGKGLFQFSNNQSAQIKHIRILHISGIILKDFKVSTNSSIDEIDIADLKPGIYFAEIYTSKGRIVKRLIKE